MFGKKKEPIFNVENTDTYGTRLVLLDAITQLIDMVEVVESRRLAIGLLPDGPDKRNAEERFKTAQLGLVKAISQYNAARNSYNEALERERDKLPNTWHFERVEAAQRIEIAIKNFYQRG
jgi:hypothetical protein